MHVLMHQPLNEKKRRCVTGWENHPIAKYSQPVSWYLGHQLELMLQGLERSLALPGAWGPDLHQLKLAIFNKTQTECVEEKGYIFLRCLS